MMRQPPACVLPQVAAPAELKELEEKIANTEAEKDEAVNSQEFERAAALRDSENKLKDELQADKGKLAQRKQPLGRRGTAKRKSPK